MASGFTKLRHHTAPFRTYGGADSLQQLAAELDRAGLRRAVVFCGRSITQHPAGLALVQEALGARVVGVFDDVKAHSPLPAVLAGMDRLRELAADAVIALGGGSAVVTARASAVLLAEGKPIHELCTQFPAGKAPVSPKLSKPKLPQFVVPTTPTTAYAKAGSAVSDPVEGRRMALFDPKTRAAGLFVHPDLACTAPVGLVKSAALNALCLAVQGLESRNRDPLADALLLHGLRLTAQNLRQLQQSPDDAGVRMELMLAALLAGQGTDYAPPGLNSAVAHVIGGRFHLDNGLVNAILLPHTMQFNASVTGERLRLIPQSLGEAHTGPADASAIAAVQRLLVDLGVPKGLREAGVREDALSTVAEDVAGDWFLRQNPRPVGSAAEILEVLKAAF
jgi:alcohol dehydrogenase class IV